MTIAKRVKREDHVVQYYVRSRDHLESRHSRRGSDPLSLCVNGRLLLDTTIFA